MLRLTKIVAANGTNFTDKHLVVLHFTDCSSTLLGASFAANDYAITASLDAITPVINNPQTGALDLQAMLAKANDDNRGKEESQAFGFIVPVGDILGDPTITHIKPTGTEQEIALRRIMGIGNNEESARIDALNRESARLRFAIGKGKIQEFRTKAQAGNE